MSLPTITYNGVDFESQFGFFLTKIPHPIIPGSKTSLTEGAWRQGGYINQRRTQAKRFQLSGVVKDTTSPQDAMDKLDEMASVLNSSVTRVLKISQYLDGREWLAILNSEMNIRWVGHEPVVSFEMLAPDPRGLSVTEKTDTWTTNANPYTDRVLDTVGGLDPQGSDYADPIIEINPNGDVVADKVIETLDSSSVAFGESVTINDPSSGEENNASFRIRVNTATKSIEVSTDAGVTWTADNTRLQTTTGFPILRPRNHTKLRVTGFAVGSTIVTRWKDTFA